MSYYIPINHLPECCTKCPHFTNFRDGWCEVNPAIYVDKYAASRHPECPIIDIPDPTKTEPLSLEELSGVDGIPVWIETLTAWKERYKDCGDIRLWKITKVVNGQISIGHMALPLAFSNKNYGTYWLAYTRKMEADE